MHSCIPCSLNYCCIPLSVHVDGSYMIEALSTYKYICIFSHNRIFKQINACSTATLVSVSWFIFVILLANCITKAISYC